VAIKVTPDPAFALMGRAIAKQRTGDAAGARADMAAARKESPLIDKEFAEFGYRP